MAKTYRVSDIARNLTTIIDKHLGGLTVLVEGEISNLVLHSNRHIYFNLKDDQSSVACFVNKSTNLDRSFLKNGNHVILKVKINYSSLKNEAQLYVYNVQLFGEGELFSQLQKLKNELAIQGYFDDKFKKPIPEYPKSIGIITSIPSAALKDVLITLEKKCPIVDVELYPTLVQGKNASASIIQQLQYADDQNHDILLLVRGGGSIEDLWCFNDKKLCVTIFNLKTPIISGIGHQQDYTLADFVVDKRSATPTAAANDAVYSILEAKQELSKKNRMLLQKIEQKFNEEATLFYRLKSSSVLVNPELLLQNNKQKIRLFDEKLKGYSQNTLQIKEQLISQKLLMQKNIMQMINLNQINIEKLFDKLIYLNKKNYEKYIMMNEKYYSLLNAYSHTKILERGYSIVKKDNVIINNIEKIKRFDEIEIILKNGKIKAKVREKNE